VGLIQPVFAWCDGDGAVAPTTGEHCLLERPSLHADMFQLFIEALAQAFPASLKILLLDHSGAHPAQGSQWPEHVRYVWGPPDGPELNPMARVWRDVKDDVAWRQCTDVNAPQTEVGHWLGADEATALQALTGYADVVEAIHALSL
jgi:hypothetical protein